MFYAVILAGGSGTRLWPLSRSGDPKFLHALTGTPATLLQATIDRVAPLAEPSGTFVVTGAAHAASVARQAVALPEANIIVEPSPRDSCAAIGLAAAIIAEQDPEAIMGAFAADHLIADSARFVDVLREAVRGAESGFLMTVGISPTRAETGYGYLQCGAVEGDGPVRRVEEFKEKPPQDVAEAYVASGRYLWNAGMFVWRVRVFLEALARTQPALHDGLRRIAGAWGTDRQDAVMAEVWPGLTKISVDYAVMEASAADGRVATVPGDFGWNDVGDFNVLGDVLPADADGNVVVAPAGDKPDIMLIDTTDSVVVSQTDRLVTVLGMDNVVVVDTQDAILVCPRERAQDVKGVVDALKDRGDTRYT